jgi:VWFA-related protein
VATSIICPVLAVSVAFGLASRQDQQPPVFKSAVELVAVEVQVVDREGKPITGLGARDFRVKLDRNDRRVVSADFVQTGAGTDGAGGTADRPAAVDAPPTPQQVDRAFILAIDESSFHTRHAPAAVQAARRFIQQLGPRDQVALYTYPVSQSSFLLTTDHAAVLKELDSVVGVLDVPRGQYQLGLADVIEITAGSFEVLTEIAKRVCPARPAECYRPLREQAQAMAIAFEAQVAQSVAGLRRLLQALGQHPGRKTLVLISGGLLASTRPGARPDVNSIITTIGEEAARADASLYVLHMDSSFIEAFSPSGSGSVPSFMRDPGVMGAGLERFAGVAGGALIRVQSGSGDPAFGRVLRETSAYYLLGVEPHDRERDGRPHYISVEVKRRGAEVRARRTVIIPAPR